jgi:hypothetical protein
MNVDKEKIMDMMIPGKISDYGPRKKEMFGCPMD